MTPPTGFEAWWKEHWQLYAYSYEDQKFHRKLWEAAEASTLERAAQVAEEYESEEFRCLPPKQKLLADRHITGIATAIRALTPRRTG